jgi:cobaltochelatase CobS
MTTTHPYAHLTRQAAMAEVARRGIRTGDRDRGNFTRYSGDALRDILRDHDAGLITDQAPPPSVKAGTEDDPMTARQHSYLAARARNGLTLPDGWEGVTKAEASVLIGTLKAEAEAMTEATTIPRVGGADALISTTRTTTTRPAPADAADALRDALEALGVGGRDDVLRAEVEAIRADLEALAEVVTEGTRPEVRITFTGTDPRDVKLPDVHHPALPTLIGLLRVGANVLLVGPAGTGKSTLAEQAAEVLEIPFHAMPVGPNTPTSKLWGYQDANGTTHRTGLREAYEHGGVYLLDELDNGHAGIITELNQATSNGYTAFPDGMVTRHPDCRFIGTANTYGTGPDAQYVGRNVLDAATRDRFIYLEVDYDRTLERSLAEAHAEPLGLEVSRAVAWCERVWELRDKAQECRLPVIIGTRAILNGLKVLSVPGLSDRDAIRMTFGAAMKPADRDRLGV